jgi:flagellar protein FliL
MAKKAKATKDSEEGGKKKSKKKLIIIILAVLVVGGAGYMKMHKKPAGKAGAAAVGPITVESSLTVNLRGGHYLQFTAGIQTSKGQSDKILTTDQAIVLDVLNAEAGNMTEAQLLQPDGPAHLKTAIVGALNHDWPGLVERVYFEQFVMQ